MVSLRYIEKLLERVDAMSDELEEWAFPCRKCQAGKMQLRSVTYITWLGDDLVTVPDFPAWMCDFCGRREYDSDALTRLSLLLSPEAGRKEKPQRPLPPQPDIKSSQPSTVE